MTTKFKPYLVLLLCIHNPSWAQTTSDPNGIPPEVIEQSDQASELDKISTEQLRELIFNDLVEKRSLLTEQQLRELHQLEQIKINATKRATPPQGIKEVIPVSFDPHQPTARIYVTPGWNSHISIIDQGGNPWPIAYLSHGNQLDFSVNHVAAGSKNTIEVESIYTQGSTNLTLLLDGVDDLFTLELIATSEKFHPLATIRVNEYKDQSNIPDLALRPSLLEKELRHVLHQQIPAESELEPLMSSDPRVMAWYKNENMYIRTHNLRLLAPSALAVEHGAGSIVAYKAPYLPAISLTNDNGTRITVTLDKNS